MSKLQEENKQLRLDLVLYQQNIKPTTTINHLSPNHNNEIQNIQLINNNNNNSTSTVALSSFESSSPSDAYHTSDSSDSPPDLNMFDDFNVQQFTLSSEQQLSTTTTSQFWDLSTLPEFNINDMYLSHAMMPHWDINNVLSKSNEQTSPNNNNTNTMEIFQKYPLLAPALMSIVIGHTMTLSANDLLKLNYSTNDSKDMIMVGNKCYPTISGLTEKQTLKIWELLQPITENNDNNVKALTATKVEEINEKEDDKETTKTTNDHIVKENEDEESSDADNEKSDKPEGSNDDDNNNNNTFHPVSWAHRYIKAYVCSYVHNYIDQCRIYNSIKQQQQHQNDENVTSSYRRPCTFSTPLCKHLKRAKERFVPVS